MQLFNGTLRCLQGLHTAKFNVKFVAQTYGATNKTSSCFLAGQQRRYANTPAIAMSSEQFDAPTSDASKTPLITAHGLFGSKQNWRSVSRAIAKETHRRIYTVDLRNHGDSPHTDTHGSPGMTADIAAFLAAKSINKTSLMGHSMGGRAVMHFALTNPHLVDRLIVVDISPVSIPRTIDDMDGIMSAMLEVSLPAELSLSEGRQRSKKQLLKTVGADSVDFILLNLRKRPQTGEFYWACNVEVLRRSLTGFLDYGQNIHNKGPFTGPTTFICGTHSEYMNPNDWPQVLHYFPNASLHWLETGHLVHLEKPHDFIRLTTDFLNR
ncbi:protein ABHD11 [Drosophila innubila]|uniref:protein ABHD11 n=1 Tax=Drosophila innubila TaxID=198719 RepID=UPI00148DF167|nr:protein ABHD11 [Drosophila innubila]